jgi:Tol biopolymer transport system component
VRCLGVLLVGTALMVPAAGAAHPERAERPIVFLSDAAPHFRTSELYSIGVRGGAVRNLTRNEIEDVDPSLSPDGRTIVFARERRHDFDLYVMPSRGGRARRLLHLPGPQREPAWSPDGRRIAFVSRGRDANEKGFQPDQVFVVGSDGRGARQLTHVEDGVVDPAWAPDGSRLAASTGSTLVTFGSDGSNPTELSPAGEGEGDAKPAWSPDGSRIAFQRGEIDFTATDVWVANADGGGARRIARWGSQPVWSPDGRRIAFVNGPVWVCQKAGCYEPGLAAVATIGVNGGRRRYLTKPVERLGSFAPFGRWSLGDGATYFGLRWAPNGRTLYYSRRLEQRAPDLFAVSPRGGRAHQLTFGDAFEANPRVSPDGKRVIFERYGSVGGAPSVWLMRTSGGGARRLTAHGGVGAWSPDGEHIAYIGRAVLGTPSASRIYVADGEGRERRPLAAGTSPTWAPDARTVAFIRVVRRSRGERDTIALIGAGGTGLKTILSLGRHQLYGLTWSPHASRLAFLDATAEALATVEVESGRARRITRAGRFFEGVPSWSPDGRRLAFERRRPNPNSGFTAVFVARADGTGAHRLGRWRRRDTTPSWSPDGSRIALARVLDGDYELVTVRPSGRDARRLTNNLADDIEPSW